MTSIDRRRFLALSAAVATAATAGSMAAPTGAAHAEGRAGRRYFPQGGSFDRLRVINADALDPAEGVLAATLQGLVARAPRQHPLLPPGAPRVYISTSDASPTSLWLDDLQQEHGVEVDAVDSVWDLLARYRKRPGRPGISGYLLYDDDASLSVATTLAGLTRTVAVHTSLEQQAVDAGLQRFADVSGRDDRWLTATHGHRIRRDFAIEQKPSFSHQLRDLSTMAGAQLFYDGNTDYRRELVSRLQPDSPVIGWGDASSGEDSFVSTSSKAGTFVIAADWASNLSTLSGVRTRPPKQRGRRPAPPAASGTHHVTFVVTDGDNVQWFLTSLQRDPKWWAAPERGSVPLGWGMAPTLVDLAPSVMRWYYRDATEQDEFVVGPSGSGYFYPSQYPADRLRLATETLASYMERTDLGVVQILDFEALDRVDVWDQYTRHDAVDGLFYLEYSRYDGGNGRIVWSNDKPVISARRMLWDGLDGADEQNVADAINAAPRDPGSADSYTLVSVHAWSKDLAAIRTVVEKLDPHVRVVSPGAFTRLVSENVRR